VRLRIRRGSGADEDARALSTRGLRFHKALAGVDRVLGDRPYIWGRLSAADIPDLLRHS